MSLLDKVLILKNSFGFNTSEVARNTGINQSTLAKFVSGERNISKKNEEILNDFIEKTLSQFR